MRNTVLVLALLTASAPAFAQPEGPQCDVVIARAPDAVRTEIERWVAAEPRCARGLEVRVLETPEGLYLFARDDRGFTRERVVPDATTAGALVASWIADDSVDGVWMYAPPAPAAITPAPYVAPAPVTIVDRGRTLRTFGIVTAAIGLVVVAGGIQQGVEAKRISDNIRSQPATEPWPTDILEREQAGERAERREFLMLAGGTALVVTGAVTYLVGRSRAKTEVLVVPTASSQSAGVGLVGRF
jgi:hypothetical protein